MLMNLSGFSCNSTRLLVGSWLFCIQHLPYLVSCGACLEVVWRFERRTFYIGSLRVKLVLACQEVLKRVRLSMNLIRLLFTQC